ncbi:hypothetical protein A2U01_0079908, partial [Trifolium medium]|nr:hypothetical protein [Trifolium medium]
MNTIDKRKLSRPNFNDPIPNMKSPSPLPDATIQQKAKTDAVDVLNARTMAILWKE